MDVVSVSELRELSDERLVSVLADQPPAFEVLFERYRKLVSGIASAYAANTADADDYVQEGMLALLAAASTYSQEYNASFRTYAAVCVRNRIRNVSGRERAACRNSANSVSLDDPEQTETALLIGDAESPENLLLEKERSSELFAKLSELLSKQERETFLLAVRGFTYAEIAARLKISEKSVDNAIQRARRKLRAVWSNPDTAANRSQNRPAQP